MTRKRRHVVILDNNDRIVGKRVKLPGYPGYPGNNKSKNVKPKPKPKLQFGTKSKSKIKQDIFKKALMETKKVLDELEITFWLACGTALGFYRGKEFIEHDRDIDIGVFIKHYTPDLITQFRAHNFKFLHQYGTEDNGLELAFKLKEPKSPKVDIFFIYEEEDYYWRSFYEANDWKDVRNKKETPVQFMTKFKKFRRITVNHLDTQFLVPEIGYIEELYGENWRIPETNYTPKNAIIPSKLEESNFFDVDNEWQEHITIGIKTILRPTYLKNCLDSIRLFYPNIKVIVLDDSNDTIKAMNKKNAELYSGIDMDQNITIGTISTISTKYMVAIDDNIIFNYQTDLKKMYEFLEETNYDIIGGHIRGRGTFSAKYVKYTQEPKIVYLQEKQTWGPIFNSVIKASR